MNSSFCWDILDEFDDDDDDESEESELYQLTKKIPSKQVNLPTILVSIISRTTTTFLINNNLMFLSKSNNTILHFNILPIFSIFSFLFSLFFSQTFNFRLFRSFFFVIDGSLFGSQESIMVVYGILFGDVVELFDVGFG